MADWNTKYQPADPNAAKALKVLHRQHDPDGRHDWPAGLGIPHALAAADTVWEALAAVDQSDVTWTTIDLSSKTSATATAVCLSLMVRDDLGAGARLYVRPEGGDDPVEVVSIGGRDVWFDTHPDDVPILVLSDTKAATVDVNWIDLALPAGIPTDAIGVYLATRIYINGGTIGVNEGGALRVWLPGAVTGSLPEAIFGTNVAGGAHGGVNSHNSFYQRVIGHKIAYSVKSNALLPVVYEIWAQGYKTLPDYAVNTVWLLCAKGRIEYKIDALGTGTADAKIIVHGWADAAPKEW